MANRRLLILYVVLVLWESAQTDPSKSSSKETSAAGGETCFHNRTQASGICRKHVDCEFVRKEIATHKFPQRCNNSTLVGAVCCPLVEAPLKVKESIPVAATKPASSTPPPAARPPPKPTPAPELQCVSIPDNAITLAERKCWQYADLAYDTLPSISLSISESEKPECSLECGFISETLIVGGELAKPMQFPHMVAVGYEDDRRQITYHCGGSLISPDFVLTAAHCLYPSKDQYWALMGTNSLKGFQEASAQLIDISEVIPHPEYKQGVKYYDIGLLRLFQSAELNPHVRPACLHTKLEIPGKSATATGFGLMTWDDAKTVNGSLLLVSLNYTDNRVCTDSYRYGVGLSKGIVAHQMCAGGREQKGKDTCMGDSGGPLQYQLSNPSCMYKIVGITSFGLGCGTGAPGVYSRVSHFVPWIESIVWPLG